MAGIQHARFNFVPELPFHPSVQQFIFIDKMLVKGSAVDLRFFGHILHRDGIEAFFRQQVIKSTQNQITSTFDAWIEFFFFWQHFGSSVAYPTILLFYWLT